MFQKALDAVFRTLIRRGRLHVVWPDGSSSIYGEAPGARPEARFAFRSERAVKRLLLNPELAAGELYMEGELAPVGGSDLFAVLDLLTLNTISLPRTSFFVINARRLLAHARRRVDQFNPARKARRNAAHHYDLSHTLYDLFLDRDRQYSCAYFPTGNETLEEAQNAKKRHIAAKLLLDRPGLSVLDIGCGWGGLALTLARDYGATVTGITLSSEQLAVARARAEEEGLADRVSFELMDYRAVPGQFDRIVSVGMFEHVGVDHYRTFFKVVANRLKRDGVALLHTIGRTGPPGATNAWIAKYIFPGGYTPAMSEIMPPIEHSGLAVTDVEVLRRHYAQTLRAWLRRFQAHRDEIAALYDERFCRMWEFYLIGAERSFEREEIEVFQVQLGFPGGADIPLTRDYIARAERKPVMVRERSTEDAD